MQWALLPFTLSHIEFEFSCNTALDFTDGFEPWHSVLGKALRQQHCVQLANTDCRVCVANTVCAYSTFFRAFAQADCDLGIARFRAGNDIPQPHIIDSSGIVGRRFMAGDTLTLQLVLIGNTVRRFPILFKAMQQVAANGIGNQHVVLRLQTVRQLAVSRAANPSVSLVHEQQLVAMPQPETPDICYPPKAVKINFLTPFVPSSGEVMSIELWLSKLLLRIYSLANFYVEPVKPVKPNSNFKQTVAQVQPFNVDVRPFSLTGGSKHRNKMSELSVKRGQLGSFCIDISATPELWPFLYLGQFVNVGAMASAGLGRYQLSFVP